MLGGCWGVCALCRPGGPRHRWQRGSAMAQLRLNNDWACRMQLRNKGSCQPALGLAPADWQQPSMEALASIGRSASSPTRLLTGQLPIWSPEQDPFSHLSTRPPPHPPTQPHLARAARALPPLRAESYAALSRQQVDLVAAEAARLYARMHTVLKDMCTTQGMPLPEHAY